MGRFRDADARSGAVSGRGRHRDVLATWDELVLARLAKVVLDGDEVEGEVVEVARVVFDVEQILVQVRVKRAEVVEEHLLQNRQVSVLAPFSRERDESRRESTTRSATATRNACD